MTYAIKAPARYAQGAGELANLGRSAKKLGNKFLVICTDNSRGRFGAQVEASLADAAAPASFQFLRQGYFCVDSKDSAPGHLVFNRSVSLKDSFKF